PKYVPCYGMPRTTSGPSTRVQASGSRFHHPIKRWYLGLDARKAPTVPSWAQYCHSAGVGSAPHCFLKRNVLLSVLQRPKSNALCCRCTARSSRCQYISMLAFVWLYFRSELALGTSVTPHPWSSSAAASGLFSPRNTHR